MNRHVHVRIGASIALMLCEPALSGGAAQPLYAFGLPHQVLGAAVIGIDDKGVLISGIGAQGDDGVAVALGAAEGWKGEIGFGPAGALPPGARVDLNVSAQLDGQLAQLHLTIQETGGGLAAVSFDAGAACEPCSLIVEALVDGKVVDSVTHKSRVPAILATGALGSTTGEGLQVGYSLTKLDADSDADFALDNPIVTPITLTGSSRSAVDADTIALRLNGLPPGIPVETSVTITAANLDTITIADEALVQFHAEHRAIGDVIMAGQLGEDGSHDIMLTSSADRPSLEVVICCAAPELDGDGATDQLGGFEFEVAFVPASFVINALWETFGRFGDGSDVQIAAAQITVTVMGGRQLSLYDPVWMTDITKTVTARLRGSVVAQRTPPGFAMWSIPTYHMPNSFALKLMPSGDPTRGAFNIITRWDEPHPVYVPFIGSFLADEVEIVVSGAPIDSQSPVEVTDVRLAAEGYRAPGQSPIMLVEDEAFLPVPERLSPADLNDDGDVDGFDLALLLGQWTGAASYAPCPPYVAADLNCDCTINGFDLALLLGAWG